MRMSDRKNSKNEKNRGCIDPLEIYEKIFMNFLKEAKIIVTTCSTAGDYRMKNLKFATCIIDDASAILEPISLIPLSLGVE